MDLQQPRRFAILCRLSFMLSTIGAVLAWETPYSPIDYSRRSPERFPALAPSLPLEITSVFASPEPAVGQVVTLSVEVTSSEEEQDVLIAVSLPEGVHLVDGYLTWRGSIRADLHIRHEVRLAVQEPGDWRIDIRAYSLSGEDPKYADTETIHFIADHQRGQAVPGPRYTITQDPPPSSGLPQGARTFRGIASASFAPQGTVTIQGIVSYEAVEDDLRPTDPLSISGTLAWARIELWDADSPENRLLASSNTHPTPAGYYSFSVPNTDPDGTGIDPYVLIWADDSGASGGPRARVVDQSDLPYFFAAVLGGDLGDGTYSYDLTIPRSNREAQAFYIFDKIANTANSFLLRESDWHSSEAVEVSWPERCLGAFEESCFFGRIYILEAHGRRPDTVIHEYGHFVESWYLSVPDVIDACRSIGWTHFLWEELTPRCAWMEGWADFFEMAVQDDPDYFGSNLEHVDYSDALGRVIDNAESYEGVVAASLWDVSDNLSEPFDELADGFDGQSGNGIWHMSTTDGPPNNDQPHTITELWSRWLSDRPSNACSGSAILQHHKLNYEPFMFTLAISADPPVGGSVSGVPAPNCPGGTYEDGTSVTLTAFPVAGYVFTGWSGDATGTTNPLSVVMDSDKSITAHFAVPTPTATPTRTPTVGPSPTPTRTPTRTPTPAPTFPRMPICGDQDGSEKPLIYRCRDLQWAGDVQLYQVPGTGPVELTFDFVLRDAAYNNELAFFLVDDALGRIGALAPGEPGYLAAAFASAQVIFPSGSNAFTPDVSVQLEGGRFIVVFIVQNSRLSTLLASNPNNELNKRPLAFFSFNPLNPDGVDHFIGYENPALDISHFGFEDLTGGGDRDFDDIAYNVIPRLQPLTARVYLSPLSAEKTVGETHTLSAEVLDKQGSPLSGELVTFEVEGANPTVGSASTNASGIATFSYVGSEEGDDTVVAHTSEAVSNTAIVLWRSSCPIRVFWGGGSSARSTGTRGGAMVLIRRLQQTVDVVRLLERVRDEVLTTTPQGQRYIDLFNLHASEITSLMLANEALRDQGIATVEAFVPALQAFVDGEGSLVVVTPEQVDSVVAFLQALSGVASPELTQDIAAELARRPLQPIAGMTMDESWDYLNNLPPVAEAGGPYEVDEGQSVVLNASGSTDPDNNIVLFEWDLDSDGEFDDAAGVTATVAFGDNGSFNVGVKVTDELGESSSDTAEIIVTNLPPEVALDTSAAISFAGGDAFLGRAGVAQSHEATATDPGSDDLTFTWDFGSTTTYFNNGSDTDPFPSPGGTFPFTAVDTSSATFGSPGKYDLDLIVVDDDEGSSSVAFTKLVTGTEACTFSQGFWKHQFSGQGSQQVDNDTLEAYLAIVNHASGLFSEAIPLNTLSEASTVMDAKGSGMRPKAQAQLLAAWLNFAHGSVGWDELVDTDGDGTGDTAFHQVIAQAEAILLNPDASQQELVLAKDLAEAVNLLDQETEGCE